jgi:hypothetical protein
LVVSYRLANYFWKCQLKCRRCFSRLFPSASVQKKNDGMKVYLNPL